MRPSAAPGRRLRWYTSRTRAEEIISRKLSTVDMTAAKGAATSRPPSQARPAFSVTKITMAGMMRSDSASIPGSSTRAQQKMMTSGK